MAEPYKKNKNCTLKEGRLNFSSKITTAAIVHLMESRLLDNWLNNNHFTYNI